MTTNDEDKLNLKSAAEIIIYDYSSLREKVFNRQHFHLKQVLNLESIEFLLFYNVYSVFISKTRLKVNI